MSQLPIQSLAIEIRKEHKAARECADNAVTHALRAGQLLIEAKDRTEHGEWGEWVAEQCSFSLRTAQAYMQLARKAESKSAELCAFKSIAEALSEPKPLRRCKCGVPLKPNEEYSQCTFCRGETKLANSSGGASVTIKPSIPITGSNDSEPSASPDRPASPRVVNPFNQSEPTPRIEDANPEFRFAYQMLQREIKNVKNEKWQRVPQDNCRHFVQVLLDLIDH